MKVSSLRLCGKTNQLNRFDKLLRDLTDRDLLLDAFSSTSVLSLSFVKPFHVRLDHSEAIAADIKLA